MNQVTAILIGAGARGQIYARYAQEHPEELRIMAVAEPKADRRALMCRAYGIPADRAFSNWEVFPSSTPSIVGLSLSK